MDYQKSGLPEYRCHKKVKALRICKITNSVEGENGEVVLEGPNKSYSVTVSRKYFNKHNPQVGGYYVLYRDGYESFSPAEAFEDGYTLKHEPDCEEKNK